MCLHPKPSVCGTNRMSYLTFKLVILSSSSFRVKIGSGTPGQWAWPILPTCPSITSVKEHSDRETDGITQVPSRSCRDVTLWLWSAAFNINNKVSWTWRLYCPWSGVYKVENSTWSKLKCISLSVFCPRAVWSGVPWKPRAADHLLRTRGSINLLPQAPPPPDGGPGHPDHPERLQPHWQCGERNDPRYVLSTLTSGGADCYSAMMMLSHGIYLFNPCTVE